jgi:serine/threonine-protein kinase
VRQRQGLLHAEKAWSLHLAYDSERKRSVAIMTSRKAVTPAIAERFLREARVVSKIVHRSLAPPTLVGEADGFLYSVTDYPTGEVLTDHLTHGPLPRRVAVKIAHELLGALETLHQQSTVHGYVSSDHVFVDQAHATLAYYGNVRLLGGADAVAPEQASAGETTPRSDVYAVGAVLYQMFSGSSRKR